MDSDRHSNVSSYYGSRDRRSSFEPSVALSQNAHPPPGYRSRNASTSSSAFVNNPNRVSQASADFLASDMGVIGQRGTAGSAGYNQTSFLAPGREEPVKGGRDEERSLRPGGPDSGGEGDGWDVYADFNNSGPRYSAAFVANENGYHKIPQGASKPEAPSALDSDGHVELVTVPALGSEWKASELREMTKSGRREARTEAFTTKWRAWRRDQTGICGVKWLTARVFVFIVFAIMVLAGIILAFTIPRVPNFAFNTDSPITDGKNVAFFRSPANFSFDATLGLEIDTHSNYLPLHFQDVRVEVFDSDTTVKIAEGNLGSKTFPGKAFSSFQLPVRFNYSAVNASDLTWLNTYNACRNKQTVPVNQSRPPLKLRLLMHLNIAGLLSHPLAGTSIDAAACPFELPTNSA